MKYGAILSAVLMLGAAPSALAAQDTASTRRLSLVHPLTLNWRNSPNTLRLYRPTPVARPAPKADMGVEPGCPMPRQIPDTSRLAAMPRARVDTTLDARMKVEVRCGR